MANGKGNWERGGCRNGGRVMSGDMETAIYMPARMAKNVKIKLEKVTKASGTW